MAAIVCPSCGLVDCDNSDGWRKVRLCNACAYPRKPAGEGGVEQEAKHLAEGPDAME